jgi:hypothetical protein
LYFACAEKENLQEDGKVWAMHRPPTGGNDIDPFEFALAKNETELFKLLELGSTVYLRILYPFYNSPRIVAQDGAFTVHSDPWIAIESYVSTDFDPSALHLEAFYSWRIPNNKKTSIIQELSGIGITERAVYPDLDGLAKSLWETDVLWHGS